MPEIGAKSAVGALKGAKQSVLDAANKAASKIVAQADAMAKEIEDSGDLVVKKLQDEHAEVMDLFAEFLGNERAGDR